MGVIPARIMACFHPQGLPYGHGWKSRDVVQVFRPAPGRPEGLRYYEREGISGAVK